MGIRTRKDNIKKISESLKPSNKPKGQRRTIFNTILEHTDKFLVKKQKSRSEEPDKPGLRTQSSPKRLHKSLELTVKALSRNYITTNQADENLLRININRYQRN